MKERKVLTLDSMPEVITAQNIADYLGISRRRVYEFFQLKPEAGGIPNFEIGFNKRSSKRAEKADFIKWIEARKQAKVERQAS